MSVSLVRDDRLWGLICCYNREPALVPYHLRAACDFVGQALSLQLAAKDAWAIAERRQALRSTQTRLLAHMAGAQRFTDGLLSHPEDLLALTAATGAAVIADGGCTCVGMTPSEPEVRQLVNWLAARQREKLFVTDSLAAVMPDGEALKQRASGVLAISISQLHDSYVLWFPPR